MRPADGEWQSAFAWERACKTIEKKSDAYFDTLAGRTHAYVNFETAGAVEVEITRANGQPIRTAAVHPQRKASACSVKDGRAFVTLDKPFLVAVDIDGQMDGQDTSLAWTRANFQTVLQPECFGEFERREKAEAADAPVTAYSPTARSYSFTTLSELGGEGRNRTIPALFTGVK